jgi:exo-1,4-beta-D-glucosaminidase
MFTTRPQAALLTVYLSVLALLATPVFAQEQIPLDTGWRLQSSAEVTANGASLSLPNIEVSTWYPVAVPRTVLAALIDNRVYPDPYYGLNLKKVDGFREGRWMVMPADSPFRNPWWYRTEFEVPKNSKGRTITLHFDGINYAANVWLNGTLIADSETVIGMFRRFEFDVTEHVLPGETNVLAVEIIAPAQGPDIRYRTKQIEATTGWDDHNPQPPDANMGIWEDVFLRVSGPVTLRHGYVRADLALPDYERAWLFPEAQLNNHSDEAVTATLSVVVEDIKVSQEVTLDPNESRWVFFTPEHFSDLVVDNPRVWWPNPVGTQELYNCDMEVSIDAKTSDAQSLRFGIRKAETVINEEGWRQYRMNGQNILIRGGAWMTSDMLLRHTEKRYDGLVRYAREANLNMLRSEGFSIRETDEFYDICDKYGVMVTQQIFGRNIQPESLAIACIEDMILRIRNHPSLVHLLGHDETFPTPTLDRAYRTMLQRYMPDRTYQPHSGAFDIGNRHITGGTRTGTRELWTYADPMRYYLPEEDARAWGFAQSGGIGGITVPFESLKRMIPEDQRWPLWTEAMSFHTVIQEGDFFRVILDLMDKRYGKPDGIEAFCEQAQVMNYESARAMYEAYGREKYKATGITTWKYNVAWPAFMTWHYIDWYQIATGAYYGAKKACEGLHIQYSYDDHSVWVVNGFYEDYKLLTATAKVLNLDMSIAWEKTGVVSVGSDGRVQALTIDFPDGLSKSHFVYLQLVNAAGEMLSENTYWLSTTPDVRGSISGGWQDFTSTPKSLADHTGLHDLPPVRLDVSSKLTKDKDETVATVTLKNPSESLAFFVHAAVLQGEGGLEVAPTFWDDNYFSVLPGQTRTLTGRLYTADLNGAAPVVKVSGWNVTD